MFDRNHVLVAGGVVPLVDIGLVLDRDYTVDMVVRADAHHSVSRMPSETVQAVCQGRQKSEQGYHVNYSNLLPDIDCADVLLREGFIPMVIVV